MSNVFISYSRSDVAVASRLKYRLELLDFNVWLDSSAIGAGTRWDTEVQTAITECRYFVILLSKSSVRSASVLDEVHLALERTKFIVPLLIEPCDIPLRLGRIQYIDATRDEKLAISQHINKLSSDPAPVPDTVATVKGDTYDQVSLALPSGNTGIGKWACLIVSESFTSASRREQVGGIIWQTALAAPIIWYGGRLLQSGWSSVAEDVGGFRGPLNTFFAGMLATFITVIVSTVLWATLLICFKPRPALPIAAISIASSMLLWWIYSRS